MENAININYKLLMQEIDAVQQDNSSEYHLKTGATHIVLRVYSDKLYCEAGSIYVGEINASRLFALYYGLTGKKLIEEPSKMNFYHGTQH